MGMLQQGSWGFEPGFSSFGGCELTFPSIICKRGNNTYSTGLPQSTVVKHMDTGARDPVSPASLLRDLRITAQRNFSHPYEDRLLGEPNQDEQ
ncbi:uncharacterized protein LOC109502159 isoform X4 [Felis catus]|uniref:uncharacterized protein LOC109502159 isoform X4 n=1 Tax=Felis catus TaxID=9685 RepID=UPI001D19F7A6|nr:uncharacterized protein LOC109502159 isoform X4 [Felis catus]